MDYIYSRVSTDKQDAQSQLANITERYPKAQIVTETASGAKRRPKLTKLLKQLQEGDRLIVAALDRLGRKTSEVLQLIEDLERRGIVLISVREGIDYSTPVGRLVTQILVSVAEMERAMISERTKAGLKAAKERGKILGKPRIPQEKIDTIHRMYWEENVEPASIASLVGVSLATVYNYLNV